MTGTNRPHSYLIVVEPELETDDADAFPGLRVHAQHGQTMISGPVTDQHQWAAILSVLAEHNFTLLSIKRSGQPAGEAPAG